MEEHSPGPEDVRLAARLCCETLLPVVDRDWRIRPADLDWSARETLEHAAGTQITYAVRLATRARERPPVPRCYDPDTTVRDLLVILESRAAVLAEVVKAAPAEARGFHQTGFADASGFAAMGCDEVLIHTDDIARAFGLSFIPPESLCRRVVRRLFPWAPQEGDAWPVLRWANGRIALPGRERLGEDWLWHSAPLSEWDGTMPASEVATE